jgi:hypothetical protein
MLSGGVPKDARSPENFIEKQDECAAPRSSSGFVTPVRPSERAAQLTSNSAVWEESSVKVPEPDFRSPVQTVVASLVSDMGNLL